ncbi:hypothetical protein O2K51_10345 [Apibacter raozihei]|uniref:hypothetical protein n=1 Tax=Apibacter raozihei TaxID=2500547 RepID=UPI000FE3C1B3|nr:hypothetical protein [Apibacter raozihei]
MKKGIIKSLRLALSAGIISGTMINCSSDDISENNGGTPGSDNNRWITIAGSLQGTVPGDGNGGMIIYSLSEEDAKNPEKEISIFDNGFIVPSQRTSRLYTSTDGNTLYALPYTGDNGGLFSRYKIGGGANFVQEGTSVNIAPYVTNAPRWGKLYDNDRTGIANNISGVTNKYDNNVYQYTRGTATTVAIDLQNPQIKTNVSFEVPLTSAEEVLGHYIFRMDSPALNRAGNKLYIGTWMRKINPATGQVDNTTYAKLGSKTIILDYPSLTNPKVITSTISHGDTSGYRSLNSFLSDDGNVYQATSRDQDGGHILKINQSNEYDDSYVFNLDTALGVQGVTVETWKYAGNGIAYLMYSHNGAAVSTLTNNPQSYLARIDLNAKTAVQVDLPYDVDMYFFQHQGILAHGGKVYVAISPVGKDGNIYVIDRNTGTVTKGAKLKNRAGAQFIGAF